MARFTTRLLAVVCDSLALLGMLAMPAQAKPGGNAGAAAACENGGCLAYMDANGRAFKNEGQSIKYVTQGNTLMFMVTEAHAVTACKQEAVAASFDPIAYTIISGTEEREQFTPVAGPDLICGFGGADLVHTLDADDVFLGGDGGNAVDTRFGGTFNGADGADSVTRYDNGTSNRS